MKNIISSPWSTLFHFTMDFNVRQSIHMDGPTYYKLLRSVCACVYEKMEKDL